VLIDPRQTTSVDAKGMATDALHSRRVQHLKATCDGYLQVIAMRRIQGAIDHNSAVHMEDLTIFATVPLQDAFTCRLVALGDGEVVNAVDMVAVDGDALVGVRGVDEADWCGGN